MKISLPFTVGLALLIGVSVGDEIDSKCSEACAMFLNSPDGFRDTANQQCGKWRKNGHSATKTCVSAFLQNKAEMCQFSCKTRKTGNPVLNSPQTAVLRRKCDAQKNARPSPAMHQACLDGFNKGIKYFTQHGKQIRTQMTECVDETMAAAAEPTPEEETQVEAVVEQVNDTATVESLMPPVIVETPKLRASSMLETATEVDAVV